MLTTVLWSRTRTYVRHTNIPHHQWSRLTHDWHAVKCLLLLLAVLGLQHQSRHNVMSIIRLRASYTRWVKVGRHIIIIWCWLALKLRHTVCFTNQNPHSDTRVWKMLTVTVKSGRPTFTRLKTWSHVPSTIRLQQTSSCEFTAIFLRFSH